MKLLRLGAVGQERPCVLLEDGRIVDVSSVAGDFGPDFFAAGGIETVRAAVAAGTDLPEVDASGLRVGPPIARPHKMLCIGLNYADHAREAGLATPTEPILFAKMTNTIVGPNDDIFIPRGSSRTDFEVELAIVIGATGRYLEDEAAAADIIAGYTIAHDVSERDFQIERGGQWVKGKSCETFNPLGPWLVTTDEVGDVLDLRMTLDLNGERQQDGTTAEMIFSPAHLVWYVSQFMVLEPGDVINSGTPHGVGMGQTPPRYLRDGDVVEIEVQGLGTQRQVARPAP
jgi:2-keto-4-pentenoate hydratase/2-oxohepta-3-ene-1,7-dioic acid hydratase in catechol pathway